MGRPEYIHCIADTRADKKNLTLCGTLDYGFMFVNIDHAYYNHLNKGRVMVCEECAKKLTDSFHEMYIYSCLKPDEVDLKEEE